CLLSSTFPSRIHEELGKAMEIKEEHHEEGHRKKTSKNEASPINSKKVLSSYPHLYEFF
ncbi:hypothetical protein HAX54_003583, partial [Datura stramonium]|nr:hypothetical protein [Datura stramonium]